MNSFSQRHQFSDNFKDFTFFRIKIAFRFGESHIESCINQESSKNIGNPINFMNQPYTEENHQCTEYNSTNDTPEQNTMLIFLRNAKRTEDYRNHENIIYR